MDKVAFKAANISIGNLIRNFTLYLRVIMSMKNRFHIRYKRHARRVGQVRHYSKKSCVLRTRAKLVTKTFHENFIVNFPESTRLSPYEQSGRFCLRNRFRSFLVCCKFQDSYVLV